MSTVGFGSREQSSAIRTFVVFPRQADRHFRCYLRSLNGLPDGIIMAVATITIIINQ